MRYIEGEDRRQMRFTSLDMMIDQKNIVRMIDAITESFYQDNSKLLKDRERGNKDTGRKAYNPKSMMGLLVYGYFYGMASSRKIERATQYNVELMWLMKGLKPDHWTICTFRRENKAAFEMIIMMFRRFLVEQEYADPTKIVFDGSKMKAYANREMLTKEGILKKLEDADVTIREYLEQMEQIDSAVEELEQANKDTEKAAQDLADMHKYKQSIDKANQAAQKEIESLQKQKKNLQKNIGKLKKKQRKLKSANDVLERTGNKRIAPNDPEAVLVKSRDGKLAGYNIQTGVDEKGHFILSSDVTTHANDQNLLNDNIDSVTKQTGQQPKESTADKGYGIASDILRAKKRGVECYVPIPATQREKQAREGIVFIYDEENDTYTCSNGKTLTPFAKNNTHRDGSLYDRYKCYECAGCPLRDKCTTSKTGRMLIRKHNEKQVQEYKKSLKSNKAKEKISKRKGIVEHPYGTIKMLMGKFNFLLKGKEKIQIEIDLYSMAYNLKRVTNMEEVCLLINKVNNFSWKMA